MITRAPKYAVFVLLKRQASEFAHLKTIFLHRGCVVTFHKNPGRRLIMTKCFKQMKINLTETKMHSRTLDNLLNLLIFLVHPCNSPLLSIFPTKRLNNTKCKNIVLKQLQFLILQNTDIIAEKNCINSL